MRVWLDDRRPPPDWSWYHARSPAEVIELLETGTVTLLSLDFDLGLIGSDGLEITGYEVVRWLEEAVVVRSFKPPELSVHSMNPPGRNRLLRGVAAIERAWARQQGGGR